MEEHYRYSVFGERKIFSSWGYKKNSSQTNNPWQYSSKRIDEESGLIFFGRRYYDSSLGRWLTPDPKGFEDGMNLYAYVLNDPLINLDLYGLNALPGMFKGLELSEQSLKGITSGTWNFATKTLTGLSGNNDDFIHWNLQKDHNQYQQREINREYINKSSSKWFANKINADINNQTFQNFEKWTERALFATTAFYAGKNIASLLKQEINFNKYFQASKSLWNQPVKTYEVGNFSTNRAYSGLDVERIVKDVRKSVPKDIAKPLSRGSTGRIEAKNWKERKAMMQVMRNPTEGRVLEKVPMTDKRWHMNDGWEKVAQNVDGVEIHYVRNKFTAEVDDFKFKNK